MKDVSGVKWAVQGGHVGLYGPNAGRQDTAVTPETFSFTPGNTPDAPEEVPDAGSQPSE
jgi:hypothetical protein